MLTSLQGHIIHITCWCFQTQHSLFYILGKVKCSSITCLIVWRKHSGLRSVERMPSVQLQPAGCSCAVFPHILSSFFPQGWSHTGGVQMGKNVLGWWWWRWNAFASGAKWARSLSCFYMQIKISSLTNLFHDFKISHISVTWDIDY